jgi:hypothetical protein
MTKPIPCLRGSLSNMAAQILDACEICRDHPEYARLHTLAIEELWAEWFKGQFMIGEPCPHDALYDDDGRLTTH